jgi:TonB family protein
MTRSTWLTVSAVLPAVLLSPPSTLQAQNGPPGFGVETMAYDVAPLLLNGKEITKRLMESYPAELREAGISGSVIVWLFVDDSGDVAEALLHKRSDHVAFDEAALALVRGMKFRPALMEEEPVAVWIRQRVDFNTR